MAIESNEAKLSGKYDLKIVPMWAENEAALVELLEQGYVTEGFTTTWNPQTSSMEHYLLLIKRPKPEWIMKAPLFGGIT